MEKCKALWAKYRQALPLIIYGIIYWLWFSYLERTVTANFQVIHMKIDDYIPFCEIFVVPYFMWFGYVALAVLLLFFTDKNEYYKSCIFLAAGMTVFLIISTLWPNGHHLRLTEMPRDNIFTQMIQGLWMTDTPTNLWPSIHVYNSIGAHLAITHCKLFSNKRWVKGASFVLAVSIILATVLIKQHSVFDMLTAFAMAGMMYALVYRTELVMALRTAMHRKKHKSEVSPEVV